MMIKEAMNKMDFFNVLEKRCSIREFKEKEVEEEKIKKIIESMRSAPSAGNLQAYEVVLVKDKKIRENLAIASYGQSFVAQAPISLVFFANPKRSSWRYGKRGEVLYSIQDATIAASYAQLAAEALGLSSVWVGAFDDSKVSKAVSAPIELRPVAIIPIGYRNEEPSKTSRREIDELVRKDKF
ncbi:MAG: nitroreductase family protein [Candidatus Thermoplasmatota archaeon]